MPNLRERRERWIGDEWRIGLALSLLLLSGCSVARAPKRAYQFAYCNKMENGHCVAWATPCGKLECK